MSLPRAFFLLTPIALLAACASSPPVTPSAPPMSAPAPASADIPAQFDLTLSANGKKQFELDGQVLGVRQLLAHIETARASLPQVNVLLLDTPARNTLHVVLLGAGA